MMRRPLAVLIACLLLAAGPAWAAPETDSNKRTAPETVPEALPPGEKEETPFSIAVLPLPFVAVYSILGWENIRLGPTRHYLKMRGGYVWATNFVYAPTQIARPDPLPPLQDSNFYNLIADWNWHMTDRWSLAAYGYFAGGGILSAPGYDAELAGGNSLTFGPHLRYADLDDFNFPTRGTWFEAGYAPGYHWGAANLGFHRMSIDASHYFPLAPDMTIAVRAVAKAATPKLAWIDKFYAGGAFFLRGYEWNRFTGDRLLSGSVELRHLFLPDMLKPFGVDLGTAVGLEWHAFVDAGRAWESTQGVPFLSDPRLAGGAGITLMVDRTPIGRIEVTGGPEGLYAPVFGFGAAF